jgi:mannose-6-phosphate isomerase-like protein (cupin superfamily)
MPLHVKAADVPERKVVRTGVEGEGAMVVRRGYGNECSLMYATRAPGYHTTPHAHEAEQINYVLEGEIWFFVEERGFLCKAGDFHRIPTHKFTGRGTAPTPTRSLWKPMLQPSSQVSSSRRLSAFSMKVKDPR